MQSFLNAIRSVCGAMALLLMTAPLALGETESEQAAIRRCVEAYVEAYNRGDAKAVASMWSDSGVWISPNGEKFSGRKAIAEALANLFEENQGSRIEVSDPDIRLVTDDVAIEEGTVVVVGPGQPPVTSTYVAVHVKKDGHWKLDSVRETEIADAPARAAELEELAWLVGEWVSGDADADNEMKVVWTKNKSFLNYSFKIALPGIDPLEGTQVIGWDPAAGTIRSWMFDSDGGFGEGVWSRKGDSWVVKFSQVLPDGGTASATNIYKRLDANAFTWKSIGRNVDGELQPNIDEVVIVRKGALQASSDDATKKSEKAQATEEASPSDAKQAEAAKAKAAKRKKAEKKKTETEDE
jgi:uncharacterized protein (TIGR02246 family)